MTALDGAFDEILNGAIIAPDDVAVRVRRLYAAFHRCSRVVRGEMHLISGAGEETAALALRTAAGVIEATGARLMREAAGGGK